MKKRCLSVLLVLVLILGFGPFIPAAMAEGEQDSLTRRVEITVTKPEVGESYTAASLISIPDDAPYRISMAIWNGEESGSSVSFTDGQSREIRVILAVPDTLHNFTDDVEVVVSGADSYTIESKSLAHLMLIITVSAGGQPAVQGVIEQVKVTVSAPIAGNINAIPPQVSVPSDKGYSLNSASWCTKEGDAISGGPVQFVEGETYYVFVVLDADNGCWWKQYGDGITVNAVGAQCESVWSINSTEGSQAFLILSVQATKTGGVKLTVSRLSFSQTGTGSEELAPLTDPADYIREKKARFEEQIKQFSAGKESLEIENYDGLFTENSYAELVEIGDAQQSFESSEGAISIGDKEDFDSLIVVNGTVTRVLSYEASYKEITVSVKQADSLVRIAGANRFETSVKVADALKKKLGVEKFDTVVVACGMKFADALGGSYLAIQKQAPILVVDADRVPMIQDYIKQNLNPGGTVYILGGTAAVPAEMEQGMDAFTVKRLAGNNRYDTNLEILKEVGVGDKNILVCSGTGFADSLSASASGLPILLVGDELTQAQKDYLGGIGTRTYLMIGGKAAVNETVEAQCAAYGSTERIGGASRYDTSTLVAKTFFSSPDSAVLSYALNFPDGLCGAPLAAAMGGPLLLVTTERTDAAETYTAGLGGIANGAVLGGEGLISNEAALRVLR